MAYQPIENYGVIGDLETVALVGRNGSIDFLCFPHFDSPSVFAAILDDDKGGRFLIEPALGETTGRQIYLPGTNVLLTRFLSDGGVAEISDYMSIEPDVSGHRLVRRVKAVHGEVRFRLRCAPRFDYARAGHTLEIDSQGALFQAGGESRAVLRLRSDVKLDARDGDACAEFTLTAGSHASFVLEHVESTDDSPAAHPSYVSESFKETTGYWRRWIAQSNYRGRWREMVDRSALTLKLLTSRRHGSIVAAPTFGLPEELGGVRNWDYRFTWIRDASFTLYALIRLGFTEEAGDFMRWIEARCQETSDESQLRIMYGLDGRHELPEIELDHLEGYRGSRPVRVGNAASDHLQLDIYGELMDSVYLYDKYGAPISHDLWTSLSRLIDWVCDHWAQPDEGIWEVRGGRREFLYSRLLCWVAVDRGIRLANKRSLPAPLDRWMKARNEIYHDVFAHFWNAEKQAFVQSKGDDALDASTLLMPLVRFISPVDPRWQSTLRAIDRELTEDAMVYRYRTHEAASDGLAGEEGTFTMCSFWHVECLSRSGDVERARYLFEKMLSYANHLGLYAEELGPRREHLGNFPQAFTHIALISAAHDIDRRLDGR